MRLSVVGRRFTGSWISAIAEWSGGSGLWSGVRSRASSVFSFGLPRLAITSVRLPVLVVMMAGTKVSQYEQAGQLGRLSASLERHTTHFRYVLLMSPDRTDYTAHFDSDRIHHLRARLPLLSGGVALLLSVIFGLRILRRATSVMILDEQAAVAGRLVRRLSGSDLFVSAGAPWAPPRRVDVWKRRRWLTRAALRRVDQVIRWPATDLEPVLAKAHVETLPHLVDADLFCPLTTTDPTRPRAIGVFLAAENEAGARVTIGVAERLARRGQGVVLQVFVIGTGAEAASHALQSEVAERDLPIQFQVLPRIEMLPDAIAHLRIGVAFDDLDSIHNLLRAMAAGVPGITLVSEPPDGAAAATSWSRFVLQSEPTEQAIARNIEALLREPGIRLRMAREGRRFVIANHSLEAVATRESLLLRGADRDEPEEPAVEPEFDADTEAETLAQMLEAAGVARPDSPAAEATKAVA